jgi:sporulation protein YlmC with PRC-barrel domain
MERKFRSREYYVGKRIIDVDGMIVGNLKDINFDMAMKEIVFTASTPDGTEVTLNQNDVSAVGDVVLLKSSGRVQKPTAAATPSAPQPAPAPPSPPEVVPFEPTLCPKCGFRNEPATKFCIKCGTRLR